jgi:LuxR family maltose regulon positive regulatory protein
MDFLARTSILDRMCGPLCDAVTHEIGSAKVLEDFQSRNLLVVPLDRRGEWYRYHHLLHELLQAELQRKDPTLLPDLHTRAADWFEANNMAEEAVGHGQAAGDASRVARLVLDLIQPVWASGRVDTVLSWMEWLGGRLSVPHYSAIAAHGALIFALLGRPSEAERWAAVAERLPATGTLPDGSTEAATLAYLRANLGRDGPEVMRWDAAAALDGLSPASPYRATMLLVEGLSYLLQQKLDSADAVLAHSYDVFVGDSALPPASLVLAERAQVAVARDDWPAAYALVKQALAIVQDQPFEDYWTSAIVYASGARAAARSGRIQEARTYARKTARMRPLLT